MNKTAKQIIKTLNDAGYSAYFVGGCVRDQLLNVAYDDIDIATAAQPKAVMALFDHAVATGLDYGTVTVCMAEQHFEVTTFRREYDYVDGRHPTVVHFSDRIEDDLSRRDFTINAMALTASGELIDPYGGAADLAAKLIRTVGDAADRFAEDKLRKLRAVRLAAQKDFRLDAQLRAALSANPDLNGVSVERILTEFNKILLSAHPEKGLRYLADCGLLNEISPKLAAMVGFDQCNPHHKYDLFEHTLRVVAAVPPKLNLRWAALLHDVGKLDTMTFGDDGIGHFYDHQSHSVTIGRRLFEHLRAPNRLKRDSLALVKHHMYRPVLKERPLRRWINKIGSDQLDDMMALMRADMLATGTLDDSFSVDLARHVDQLLKQKPIFSRADLAVDGHLLMRHFKVLEARPKLLKPLLANLVAHCIECPADNTVQRLLALTERWLTARANRDGGN